MTTTLIIIFIITLVLVYKFGTRISGAVITRLSYGATPPFEKLTKEELVGSQHIFFKTVFSLLGYIAKSDGTVNNVEVKLTEKYMEKMSLTPDHKREAIQLFKHGAERTFNLGFAIKDFKKLAERNSDNTEILLVYLVNLAHRDGALVEPELSVIHEVAENLGFNSITFNNLLQLISSQNKFTDFSDNDTHKSKSDFNNSTKGDASSAHNQKKSSSSEKNTGGRGETNNDHSKDEYLIAAYNVLGIPLTATDDEIKRAYKRLANKHHPDKLTGQGMPDFMVKASGECFKKIQAAYAYIRKNRVGSAL